jgi:hypothetical protein
MVEQDAAPAGGRRTRLPRTRAARGAPSGGHYEPPAGSRLRGAAVKPARGRRPGKRSPAQQVPFTTVGEAE